MSSNVHINYDGVCTAYKAASFMNSIAESQYYSHAPVSPEAQEGVAGASMTCMQRFPEVSVIIWLYHINVLHTVIPHDKLYHDSAVDLEKLATLKAVFGMN